MGGERRHARSIPSKVRRRRSRVKIGVNDYGARADPSPAAAARGASGAVSPTIEAATGVGRRGVPTVFEVVPRVPKPAPCELAFRGEEWDLGSRTPVLLSQRHSQMPTPFRSSSLAEEIDRIE